MAYNALLLREYDRARIGNAWDAGGKAVSRREAALLEYYQRKTRRKLFEIGISYITATNWVGVIGVANHCIEVIPKIDVLGELKARENFLYMISRAGLVPLAAADIARLTSADKPLLVAYMELYVDQLASEWRKGQIKRYILFEENRNYIKGKLLFPMHLRKNFLHKERFFTASDEFTCDNKISQLLKAALRVCQEQGFSNRVAQKARSLMPDFEDVTDVNPDIIVREDFSIDRLISRFIPLLNLAKSILKDISPSPAESGSAVYSLMFDMNIVFERFIAVEVKAALREESVRVEHPAKSRSLLLQDGQKRFALKPDIGIVIDNKYTLLDTKWKRLDITKRHNNVSQSDVYQMYAYGKEYDSQRVILLYPHIGDFSNNVATYCHWENEPAKKIEVRTIDVSSPLSDKKVRSQLRKGLKDMVVAG